MKVFLQAYGCSSNLADLEIASGLLERAGFEIVEDHAKSDVNVILTCVVKEPTFNKMIHKIEELTRTGKPLVVAGCMAKTDFKIIEKINPRASLVTPDNVVKIVEAVRSSLEGKKLVLIEDVKMAKVGLPRCRKNPVVGIVEIGRGCTSNCSYCYEPYRGKLFSYPLNQVLEEVERSLKEGCREIWLTSLDCGCYGFEIGLSLVDLLREVVKLDGKFFIRVGMMNPLHVKNFLRDLIEVYENEKMFKFLHLPLQSGSDEILRLMKRGYEAKDFLKIVKKFRKAFPELSLSTDVIIGFPGETEKNFEETLNVLKKVEPDVVNVSKFGARPGTEAMGMEKVDREKIKERSLMLSSFLKKIFLERNERWVGWRGEVIVDEIGKRNFVARNFAYKPIVLEKGRLGEFVRVEVKEVRENFLIGKV
ncbi:MAG: tRNA (N(6)-L-threonylcarbamoyladenosine(37)-C(2))-methylthiotransferase [Candidatus Aenigmatarchaeota archaeon]